MTNALSKLKDSVYGREWSFPYNCYEVGHGWTPFCTRAAWDVGFAAFKNSLPLYTSLYLFTQLGLQRKYNPEAFGETLKSIVTSSSFLGFNLFSGIGVSCILRNNSDRYYYRLQCLLPGFVGSYLALLIERPSRRPALAFYMANLSSELLYKWFTSRGYIRSLANGETILFALGMACWLRFVRIHGFGHDPVSVALKYLIGPYEAKSRAKAKPSIACNGSQQGREIANHSHNYNAHTTASCNDNNSLVSTQNAIANANANDKCKAKPRGLQASVTLALNRYFSCHPVCPHKGVSCLDYTLSPAVSRFLMAYTASSLATLLKRYPKLLATPGLALKDAFTARSSVNVGLFLSVFVATTKGVNCLLRRATGAQEPWHSALAGGLAGMSMLFAPKSTLSTYILWKCLEQYFFLGVKQGVIKHPEQIICLVYALSVNVLLYIFALEPRFIRPSYMKFIDNISDHKLHQVNRMVLDVFGTGASIGYEDFFPDLDPKYMSREFHELIFNWLIQPYE